jgi:hypothetical protein
MAERRLPLLCPSNHDPHLPYGQQFHHEKCTRKACFYWKNNQCSAGNELMDWHEEEGNFANRTNKKLPNCPISSVCTWNVSAVARGEPGCVVRRLGLLCEHQGGDWATWEVALPDDPCWRRKRRR